MAPRQVWLIEWRDAAAQAGWAELDKTLGLAVFTVGVILFEDAERLCIASSWGHDLVGDITHIPIEMVQRRKKMK